MQKRPYFEEDYTTPTPRRAALLLIPRPRAAARLMARQLRTKPVNLPVKCYSERGRRQKHYDNHLKNATRDKDRSSRIVREEAKIERRTAGVTGMRLGDSLGGDGCGFGGRLWWVRTLDAVTVEDEFVAVEGMSVVSNGESAAVDVGVKEESQG